MRMDRPGGLTVVETGCSGDTFREALEEIQALQQRLLLLHDEEVVSARNGQHAYRDPEAGTWSLDSQLVVAEDGKDLEEPRPTRASELQQCSRAGSHETVPEREEKDENCLVNAHVSFEAERPGEGEEEALQFSRTHHVSTRDLLVGILEVRPEFRPDKTLRRRMSGLLSDGSLGNPKGAKQSVIHAIKSISSWNVSESGPNRNYLLHPQCRACFIWDIMALILIVFELILTPVQVFVIPDERLLTFMDWVAPSFWTADLLLTFCRAIYINSEIEWRFKKVALHYLRSWFVIDLLIIVPDWLGLFAGVVFRDARPFFRTMRLLKLMRLLRLLKMERVVQGVQARMNSTYSIHFLGILRLVACIAIFNHILACGWYRLGVSFDDGWAVDYESNSFLGYCTALHWSLTQFHGSMEVNPRNIQERIFAVVVVVVALIGFSQFLSSLTDMMIHLQRLRHASTRQQDALRSYLMEHNISVQTSISAKRYIEYQGDVQQRQAYQLEVIKALPRKLQMDLHEEARMPILTAHTLFADFRYSYPRVVRMVCHEAVSQLALHAGETLFTCGDACGRMLFVEQGTLVYSLPCTAPGHDRRGHVPPDQCNGKRWKLHKEEWICEIAMWTVWVNVGDLCAIKRSTVLEVDAMAFVGVLRKFELAYIEVCLYAQDFIQSSNRLSSILDLDLRSGERDANGQDSEALSREHHRRRPSAESVWSWARMGSKQSLSRSTD